MKQNYNLESCLIKHLEMVFSFSKIDTVIEWRGKTYSFPKAEKIVLHNNFFRSIKCQRCGNCCRRYWNIWDSNLVPAGLHCNSATVKINGIEKTLYFSMPLKVDCCRYLVEEKDSKRCLIYQDRPLLSRLPHIFINSKKGVTTIQKRQFMRNHALKCKSKIEPFSIEELIDCDIPTLEYLERCISNYQNREDNFLFHVMKILKNLSIGDINEKVNFTWQQQDRI